MEYIRHGVNVINQRIGTSTFGRIFRLQGSGHPDEIDNARFLTEVRAGITSFFTMAYIIAVNASILKASGGTCVCNDPSYPANPNCDADPAYAMCLNTLNRDLITATAAICALACFSFGFLTNMPVVLGPGMGLNAYFAYQVVGFHGTGKVPYRLALTAVFIEGWIFIFLSLIGMRQWLVRILPNSLKIASACGIGLYMAEIGLSYSAGIGLISGAKETPLTIAGCSEEYLVDGTGCSSHQMRNPTMWIGIFAGGVLTALLMLYRIKSAFIIGILVVSIISWPRDTPFTAFPRTDAGDASFDFFKKVASFHPIQTTLNVVDWDIAKAPGQFALALFTFLYVDIIDCTATLYSMARFAGVVDPQTKDFPRSTIAYCTDAFSISIGALLGTSPVTAFLESAAGIAEGGRTGLTAMTAGICFVISLGFAPIFASIPSWATGCTLVLVGCSMMRQVTNINWNYMGDAIPAFVTLICVPFTYSTAYGLIAGIMTFIAINVPAYIIRKVSFETIVPHDKDKGEYWSLHQYYGTLPWFIRAPQAVKRRFWHGAGDVEADSGHEDGKAESFETLKSPVGYTVHSDVEKAFSEGPMSRESLTSLPRLPTAKSTVTMKYH